MRYFIILLHDFITKQFTHRSPISKFYLWLDRQYLLYLTNKHLNPRVYRYSDVYKGKTILGKTKISRVAIYVPRQGLVYVLDAPAHHHNVLFWMFSKGYSKVVGGKGYLETLQGFMTSSGKFIQRRQGFRLARGAKQLLKGNNVSGIYPLFSEDMWSLSEDPRFDSYFFRYRRRT